MARGSAGVLVALPDGNAVRIRVARPGDAAGLLSFLQRVFAETDLLLKGPGEAPADVLEQAGLIRGWRRAANSTCLVGELDGEIVAHLVVFGNPLLRRRHVGEVGMSVLRRLWGRGIGSAMLQQAVDWATRSPVLRKLTLQVYASNRRAIRLYERFGFQVEGVLRAEVLRDDGRYEDLLVMSRAV